MSKQIEISDHTYQAIAAIGVDVSAFVEKAAQQHLQSQPTFASQNSRNLVERFREFRGAMKGISIEEIVASRHTGLR